MKPDAGFDFNDIDDLAKAIADGAIIISNAWKQIIIATLLLAFMSITGIAVLTVRHMFLIEDVLEEVRELENGATNP